MVVRYAVGLNDVGDTGMDELQRSVHGTGCVRALGDGAGGDCIG